MPPRDWKLFLAQGHGKEIAVAQVSQEIRDLLGAYSDKVFYHHDYVVKAVAEHGAEISDFSFVFDTIEFGRALADRHRHITFLHLTKRGWFQVTIKRAEVSRRLYICTFYKTGAAEVRRKTRRHKVIRKDKWAA